MFTKNSSVRNFQCSLNGVQWTGTSKQKSLLDYLSLASVPSPIILLSAFLAF